MQKLPFWNTFTGCYTVSAFAWKREENSLGNLELLSRNYIMFYEVLLGALHILKSMYDAQKSHP